MNMILKKILTYIKVIEEKTDYETLIKNIEKEYDDFLWSITKAHTRSKYNSKVNFNKTFKFQVRIAMTLSDVDQRMYILKPLFVQLKLINKNPF
jgi:hypothetical protein